MRAEDSFEDLFVLGRVGGVEGVHAPADGVDEGGVCGEGLVGEDGGHEGVQLGRGFEERVEDLELRFLGKRGEGGDWGEG